jgi:uncharacterized delta-60 repeat protein
LEPDSSFPDIYVDGPVYALALQADGKILVGGGFSILQPPGSTGTEPTRHLARVNANGSLDSTFAGWSDSDVYTLAVQPDGRILVGGAFSYIGPNVAGRQRIARLTSDGSIDMSFDSRLVADDYVYAIALQPDGKILVGGRFSALHTDTAGGTTITSHLARVNADGSLDSTFQPGIGGVVSSIGLQADGSIVYDRTSLPGEPHQAYVGRLLSTGVADTSFTHVEVDNSVDGLAIQPDGRIVTAGIFSWLGDATTTRANIARLTNTGPPLEALTVTGLDHATVTWMRGGTAPDLWRTTFEMSTNGLEYFSLGAGTRAAGGWQLSGVALPTNQPVLVRARGYYTTGWHNSSASIVESVRQV